MNSEGNNSSWICCIINTWNYGIHTTQALVNFQTAHLHLVIEPISYYSEFSITSRLRNFERS